jgi:hypothetical protein
LKLVPRSQKCDLGASGERTAGCDCNTWERAERERAVGRWTFDDEAGGQSVDLVERKWSVEGRRKW